MENNGKLDIQIINKAEESCIIKDLQSFSANSVKELTGNNLGNCAWFLVRSYQEYHITTLLIIQRDTNGILSSGWKGKRIEIFFDNGARYLCMLTATDCFHLGT